MDGMEVLDDELSGVGSDAIRRLTDGQDMAHEGEDNSTCDDVVLGHSNEIDGDIKVENNEQGETTTEDGLTENDQNISSTNCLSVIGSSGVATISQMSSDQAIGLELLLLNSEGQDKVQHGENSISEVPQMLQAVTFPDGTTAFIQHNKADMKFAEGQTVTLEDGTTAVVQNTTPRVEPPQEQLAHKVVEGQPIQLEDGTMAYLQTTKGPDGLQAITLEDGTTAYIAHPNPDALFAETAGLDGALPNLEQISQVSAGSELTEEGEIKTETTDTGTIRIVDNDNQERTVPFGDKAFRCMYGNCGRLYTTLHHLKVHKRSHTGDRPFKCDFLQCGKAFATGYGLKSHRRVHTGEKPYKCVAENCDKAFKTSGDLQKHVRTHTGERPFKCPFEGCTRSFTTSNIRKVHIRTHTGERPYTCTADGCNRSFASATNYKNHVRIHTGEKPYVCTVQGCGKRFTEYSSLYKHHVVHTHSKPYECTHCGKTYRQTSTLAMHKRTAHGEEVTVNEDGQLFTSEGEESNAKRPRLQFISGSGDTAVQEEGEGMLVINTSEASQTSNLENIQILPGEQTHTIQVSLPCLQQLQQQQTISGFTINEHGQQVLVVTDPIQLEALQASLQQLSGTATSQVEGGVSESVDSTATITSADDKDVSAITETDNTHETNVRVKTEQLP